MVRCRLVRAAACRQARAHADAQRLRADLDDELANAAFQLHAAAHALADSRLAGNDAFHTFMRAQLGAAPALAAHLWAALPAWRARAGGDAAGALSLRLPLALLPAAQGLAPKEARRWRRVQLSQLLSALPEPRATALRAQLCEDELSPAALQELCAAVEARGWAIPVEPLGGALYSALVRAQWDDLDEGSGMPVEEAPRLLESLRCLWPALGVSAPAHAAHRVFSAVQRWALGGSVDALRLARCVACACWLCWRHC